MVLAKPKELSWVEAAALPENWMTGKSVYLDLEKKRLLIK